MHLQIEPVATIQDEFAQHLPAIKKTVDWILLACPRAERDDARQEAIALTWKRYRHLAESGKNPAEFPTIVALWAAKHVLAGRRLVGSVSSKDALSPTVRSNGRSTVDYLDHRLAEVMVVDERADVPSQAAFRIDFPRWLRQMPRRDRQLVTELATGSKPGDLARKFGVSPARMTQKRRQFADSWRQFHGEDRLPTA